MGFFWPVGLAQDADLYLLNEPFARIDAATERAIMAVLKLLEKINQDRHCRASRSDNGYQLF